MNRQRAARRREQAKPPPSRAWVALRPFLEGEAGVLTVRQRKIFVAGAALLLVSLIAASSPRRVGDGPEYLAMAFQLSAFHRPSLSDEEVDATRESLRKLDQGYESAHEAFYHRPLQGTDGRRDFPHFWFYPALAAPGVFMARALGIHPNFGFVLANVGLLLTALWVVLGRLDWRATLLLFAGPVVWWIDKAHTEVFTFSLLAIALATLVEEPWWSLPALAAASTQNLPIALGIPLVGVTAVAMRRALWRDRRLWLGVAAAFVLVALHPLYYFVRLGVAEPQTLIGGAEFHVPRLIEMGAFVWDPNIGMLPNFPALGPVLLGAVAMLFMTARPGLLSAPVLLALPLALIFLFSFAQTPNFNSGATPGPARYGLWLIPLAIPLLREAGRRGTTRWALALAPIALVSAFWTVPAYRPGLPEKFLRPTRLAAFLWYRYPSLDNPLPEIFFERLRGLEVFFVPVPPIATASCSKVLVVGGQWPRSCPPLGELPESCKAPGAYCYANQRRSGGYRFAPWS